MRREQAWMGATTVAGLIVLGAVIVMARRPAADWEILPVDESPKQATRPRPPEVQLRLTLTTTEPTAVPMHAVDRSLATDSIGYAAGDLPDFGPP